MSAGPRALFQVWPVLSGRVPLAALGDFPTPITRLERAEWLEGHYVKRDDLSSPVYGGNKVRTLELLFGAARERGARAVFATGAYGSNHAVATALHARRVGLTPAALLFPQPVSWAALENLRVTLGHAEQVVALPHWSLLPFAMWRARRMQRFAPCDVMVPGGATPLGALGYVSAALELALQVEDSALRAPTTIVVGVGSTCTSAGLLVGLRLAAHLGIGFRGQPPLLVSVRVTPWPVTSRFRIERLAERASRLLATLVGDQELALERSELGRGLLIDGDYLGKGYGMPTPAGLAAMRTWRELGLPELDTTYSAKAAASFLARCRHATAPALFWSTKSSARLPEVDLQALRAASPRARRWLGRAELSLGDDLPAGYQGLAREP